MKNTLRAVFIFLFFSPILAEPDSKEELIPAEETISDAKARLELARALSYLKKYDDALEVYEKILQDEPDSGFIRVEIAKILFYQGKTDASFAEIEKVPENQLDGDAWIFIADLYRKKKNYQTAEKIYEKELARHPENSKVRFKLAEMLAWEKRYEDSIAHFKIILNEFPGDTQVRRHYAQVLTWMGADEEAVAEWKKTLD